MSNVISEVATRWRITPVNPLVSFPVLKTAAILWLNHLVKERGCR
uniref:Uncharacterized protein n=1 Tax=Anguilla anguilla TaxID=7936 RepID=A0A0E9UWL2_ANGAN